MNDKLVLEIRGVLASLWGSGKDGNSATDFPFAKMCFEVRSSPPLKDICGLIRTVTPIDTVPSYLNLSTFWSVHGHLTAFVYA